MYQYFFLSLSLPNPLPTFLFLELFSQGNVFAFVPFLVSQSRDEKCKYTHVKGSENMDLDTELFFLFLKYMQSVVLAAFIQLYIDKVTQIRNFQCIIMTISLQRALCCVLVLSCSVQLCLSLCDLMDCSPPGSSVHGILQARILEWVAIPFSRGSS